MKSTSTTREEAVKDLASLTSFEDIVHFFAGQGSVGHKGYTITWGEVMV